MPVGPTKRKVPMGALEDGGFMGASQGLDRNSITRSDKIAFGGFEFDSLSVSKAQRPEGFRYSPFIINIEAKLNGLPIVATGEAETLALARAKANSELLERSALFTFGGKFGLETSNGWAAHPDATTARVNAVLELVERDAILSHWYSRMPFLELAPKFFPSEILQWQESELSRSEFPVLRILLSNRGLGPSVTCLLTNTNGKGVSAHATRKSLLEAIRSAIAEACRAAHSTLRREYWGDTMKLKNGSSSPVDAGAHSVFYAYHQALPAWMFGPQIGWEEAMDIWNTKLKIALWDDRFRFTTVVSDPLTVGFATHPEAFTLRWGVTKGKTIAMSPAFKRLRLKLNQINQETHIVS